MPRLLILDEPTSALDALTAAQLHSLLISQRDKYGFSILYITHDIRTALSFCDRVVILHDGVIVEEGTTGDIARNPRHEFTLQLLRDFGST